MSVDLSPAAPSRPVAFITYDPGPPVNDLSRLWLRDHATNPDTIDPGTLEIVALTPAGGTLTISLAGDDLTRLVDAARRAQSLPPDECDCALGAHGEGCPAW